MEYEIIQRYENTWSLEEDGVRFFLLTGSEAALLIDSGMMTRNAKEIAQTLTDLPIQLLITHADMDHLGSQASFELFMMHPSEAANYYGQGRQGDFVPVYDGTCLDLGDRPLKIIHLPGHTEGSIAILDVNHRVLISGDPIQDGRIFMFGPHREIHAYVKGLERLKIYADSFDEIYPSHGTLPVKPDMIDGLIEGAKRIIKGDFEFKEAEFRDQKLRLVDIGIASFLIK